MKLNKKNAPYVFIAPFFIMFTVFSLVPIFYSAWLSFYRVQGIFRPPRFVGVNNYLSLLQLSRFLNSLGITFIYTVSHVSIMIIIALILALVLNLRIKGRNFFRLAFFLPVITSLVAAAIVFKLLLSYDMGLVNLILRWMGFARYDWLTDPKLALPSLIILGTWRWFGFHMVILLAGLQNISSELYDAAKMDGAGWLQVTWYITLPLLFPVIFFCMVISVIGSLQLFDEPYILTEGGPADHTRSIAMYLYETGFLRFRLGMASAIGYVLTIIVFIATLFQIRILGKRAGFR